MHSCHIPYCNGALCGRRVQKFTQEDRLLQAIQDRKRGLRETLRSLSEDEKKAQQALDAVKSGIVSVKGELHHLDREEDQLRFELDEKNRIEHLTAQVHAINEGDYVEAQFKLDSDHIVLTGNVEARVTTMPDGRLSAHYRVGTQCLRQNDGAIGGKLVRIIRHIPKI